MQRSVFPCNEVVSPLHLIRCMFTPTCSSPKPYIGPVQNLRPIPLVSTSLAAVFRFSDVNVNQDVMSPTYAPE